MAAKPLAEEKLIAAYRLYMKHGNCGDAAREWNVPESTFKHWIRSYQSRIGHAEPSPEPKEKSEFTVVALPQDDLDIEDLVELRIKQFGKRKEYEEAAKLIDVNVRLTDWFKGLVRIKFFRHRFKSCVGIKSNISH